MNAETQTLLGSCVIAATINVNVDKRQGASSPQIAGHAIGIFDALMAKVNATTPQHFVLLVTGDIEPSILGPYPSVEAQRDVARAHRVGDPEMKDGLFYLDIIAIDGKPVPRITTFED